MQSTSAQRGVLALGIAVALDALPRVPVGAMATPERERGRLDWSFDVTRPPSRNVTDVNVDARTGKVVSMPTETPARQRTDAVEDEVVS
jgi:hypothetical protein